MEKVLRSDLAFMIEARMRNKELTPENFIDAFTDSVQDCMKKGKRISLKGFGRFEPVHRQERMGRNPKTGKEAVIKERIRPAFKPSDGFMILINGFR